MQSLIYYLFKIYLDHFSSHSFSSMIIIMIMIITICFPQAMIFLWSKVLIQNLFFIHLFLDQIAF